MSVSDSAITGLRQLQLLDDQGNMIKPAAPGADRLAIAAMLPVIDSISPILVSRGSPRIPFQVRGRDLNTVIAINIAPATGMVGVNSQLSADGTQLNFDLEIPENVPLGERVLSVTTNAGSSDTTPSSANSFTVINGPGEALAPVVAASLGVAKGQPPAAEVRRDIAANLLGVTFGRVLRALAPSQARIGTDFTLTANGVGLDQVTQVQVTPPTGMTVGTPSVNADGTQLSVAISIAADAPEQLRQVDLIQDDGSRIAAATITANRFQVVGNQPQLASVTPNFALRGATTRLSVRGTFLDGANAVQLLPTDPGLTFSAPTVAMDGNSLSVDVAVATGVVLGERSLVVTTPAGVTAVQLTPANSLRIAALISAQITPLLTPPLGVQRALDPNAPPPGGQATGRQLSATSLRVEKRAAPVPVLRPLQLLAPSLGLAKGAVALTLTPTALALNSTATLRINGNGLGSVTLVSVNPADGISLGTPVPNADGSQLDITVNVDNDAPLGLRELRLSTASGSLPFADPARARLNLVDATPQIASLSPIQMLPGDTRTLLIRGINLGGAQSVLATPAEGIVFGSAPQVNAGGTELSIQVEVSADATAGPRVISVQTAVGASSSDATPANTLTITN